LGYTGAHGHTLSIDGSYGPDTRHAIKAFQHDYHLNADGIAGVRTKEALRQALQTKEPLQLDDRNHPGHRLFLEARKAVCEVDHNMGRTPDRQSDQLAAAMAVATQKAGLQRIDLAALSDDGTRAFAVQSGAISRIAHVQTWDAVNTTLEQSSLAWSQQAAQHTVPTGMPVHEQMPAPAQSEDATMVRR